MKNEETILSDLNFLKSNDKWNEKEINALKDKMEALETIHTKELQRHYFKYAIHRLLADEVFIRNKDYYDIQKDYMLLGKEELIKMFSEEYDVIAKKIISEENK